MLVLLLKNCKGYLVMAAAVPAAPDLPTTASPPPGAAVMTCWAVTAGAGVRVALEVAGNTGLTACERVGILRVWMAVVTATDVEGGRAGEDAATAEPGINPDKLGTCNMSKCTFGFQFKVCHHWNTTIYKGLCFNISKKLHRVFFEVIYILNKWA